MKYILQTDLKNLTAIVIACNKMPHTTHRKKQVSIQRFLPLLHCPKCSQQHVLSWNICLCLCIYGKAAQDLVSPIPFPHAKPQCIFGLAASQFWLAQSWSMWKSTLFWQSCVPEIEQEHSRWRGWPSQNPAAVLCRQKKKMWCLLIPGYSVFTRKQKASENLPKPQFYCSKVSVLIWKYTIWFFLPPDMVISQMDMGHFHRKSSLLALLCARAIHGEGT